MSVKKTLRRMASEGPEPNPYMGKSGTTLDKMEDKDNKIDLSKKKKK